MGFVARTEGSLALEAVPCCICGRTDGAPVGVGEDFEYRTSGDSFLARRCRECDLVYLDPRPTESELARIYPDNYHAFQFNESDFGIVYKVRARLEARRLLKACRGLPSDARIIDIGCGDGFHLGLLQQFGDKGWQLEGVDLDPRAIEAARRRRLEVHEGTLEDLTLSESHYDLALLIQTIEHVANPPALLKAVRRILRPGGRILLVTDNTDSLDFRLTGSRHWGGYHFPRHFNLFNRKSMRELARSADLEVETLETMMSPVNWTYSVRNAIDDWGAPRWLVDQFSLSTPLSLTSFTMLDTVLTAAGQGALLRVTLRRAT
jgi:SAM-dependent methyltransferase